MSEVSEKLSEKSEMQTELVFASQQMRMRIAPPGSAGSKGERIRKAAVLLKWKFSRTKHVWYADDRVSIKPRELRKIEEISGVRYGQQEVKELDRLISRADALLEGSDPDFYRAWVDAFRTFVGAQNRAGTSRRD